VSRPEKSLHILIKNPDTSLHIYFNPEYRLQIIFSIGDETEVSSAGEQLIRDKSPGAEVVRLFERQVVISGFF